MREHEITSGAGLFRDSVMAEGPIDAIRKTTGGTGFLGYETTLADDLEVAGIIAEQELVECVEEFGHDSPIGVVLNYSPFYGEAGGQVGDSGTLTGDGFVFRVLDTQRDGELLIHIGHLASGRLEVGARITAAVDGDRRAGIRRAHSATHLLHHALHRTIGEQATQRGSKVESDSLRFDFAHKRALSPDEIRQVEDIINARIADGAAITTEIMDLAQARESGAMALFGEKYPDRVRVVRIGECSTELCGGTHLANSGQVGLCRVVSEEPVAKGVRRIVALTGPRALGQVRCAENLLNELAGILKAPIEDLPRRAAALQEELRSTKHELAERTKESVASGIDELVASAETVHDVRIVSRQLNEVSRETLRDYVDQLRSKAAPVAIVLGAVIDGNVAMIAAVSRELLERGLNAGECVRISAKVAGGGGGGRPDMAEAGAKRPDKLPDALAAGAGYYRQKLGG